MTSDQLLSVLAALCVATGFCLLLLGADYDRDNWGGWRDADGDCQDTRQEVLMRDAVHYQLDDSGCRVLEGTWRCPYTGELIRKPSKLDVDHLVPLKEAYLSGATDWPPEKKKAYANSLEQNWHLLAVSRSANREKGAKDPAHWRPRSDAWCGYAAAWRVVKASWGLSIDSDEEEALIEMEQRCLRRRAW